VGKRRLSDSTDNGPGNIAKTPRFDSTAVLEQLKGQEKHLVEIKNTLGTLDYDKVIGQVLPQPVKDVITGLGKAVNMLLKSQENLTSVLVDVAKVSENSNKTVPVQKTLKPTDAKAPPRPPPTPVAPEVIAERKVKQAIREAEKKTLLFNIDLGNVPTMNKDTLSRKVTLALGSKASSGNHDYDIKDAEEAIDDILSCAKLEFLGTKSKQFFNKKKPQDERNNTFCTMPVRFEFKDKDVRIEAEKTLRKICNVSCAVPYPKKLRDIIDKLILEGKSRFPKCFIRTRVNVDNLTVEAHAKTNEGWIDLEKTTRIPLDILDTAFAFGSVTQVTTSSQAANASQVMTTSQVEVMCVS
jgi:hypothetical protein